MQLLQSIFKLARPKQWVKNIFVFTTLIFTGRVLEPAAILDTLVAFFSFCLASSSVYYFNDYRDLEEDKKTYVKTSESDQIFLVTKSKVDRLRIEADDFARTDEEVAKEEERRKKAAENPPPAMSGTPGTQQIPPDVMRKIQAQMANQQPSQ